MRNSALEIDMYVVVAGESRLTAYLEQTFPEEARLGLYTTKNAPEWLDLGAFQDWVAQKSSQSSDASHDATSTTSHPRRQSEESLQQSQASSQKWLRRLVPSSIFDGGKFP
ncbi:hypothetical protein C8R46DRAFT_380445 [Mycena filopes]|nr:hypothetical protein C8R46DRAFT_380445 [Mycena filopes]